MLSSNQFNAQNLAENLREQHQIQRESSYGLDGDFLEESISENLLDPEQRLPNGVALEIAFQSCTVGRIWGVVEDNSESHLDFIAGK